MVTITKDVFDTSALWCVFGVHHVAAAPMNETTIECKTPILLRPQTIFYVTWNEGKAKSNELTFVGYTQPSVTLIRATRGPVVGGTLVTVVGSALDGEAWCRFGGKMGAEASVLSSSLVVCMTPAHEEGRAVLEVSGLSLIHI